MDAEDREFQTALACYQEHSASFRDLNSHLWKIPALAMTLTGGLWYGVANTNFTGKEYALLLAAFGDWGLIIVLFRTRFIMQKILDKLELFSEKYHVKAVGEHFWQKPYCVVTVYSFLLITAGIISFVFFLKMSNLCL